MPEGDGRFGNWTKGPKFTSEPWTVDYVAHHPDGPVPGRIQMWVKTKQQAIERCKFQQAKRGYPITIMRVFRPGRTEAGLHVPLGMEDTK